MNKKKILIGILVVVIVLLLLWPITFGIDYYRCAHFKPPIFTTRKIIFDMGNENDINEKSYVAYCCGYHVGYSTTMNLKNNKKEVKKLSMYLFGKCILNVSNDELYRSNV